MPSEHFPSTLKDRLREEFNGQCAFCKTRLGTVANWAIHHYIPTSILPEYSTDPNNLLPTCELCNRLIDQSFPRTPDGEPLLLNPRTSKFDDHIKFQPDGLAVGLTPMGEATIDIVQLNRPHLLEMRRAELQATAYFRDLDLHLPKSFKVFRISLGIVRSLNDGLADGGRLHGVAADEAVYLRSMLYANVIAALESYLSDTLVGLVMRDNTSLRQFVESFLDFKKEKFELRELFIKCEAIQGISRRALRDIIYHDLPKVAGIYKDACGIDLIDFGELTKSILIRHDIVHRNGKTKEGVVHFIKQSDVEALCPATEDFVTKVDEQVQAAGATVKRMPSAPAP